MANIAPLLLTTTVQFLSLYSTIIVVRLLLTWFPNIEFMQQVSNVLAPVTDPYLNLFRFIPPIGGTLDISPILALLALQVMTNVISDAGKTLLLGY
jgi:YggT family protein